MRELRLRSSAIQHHLRQLGEHGMADVPLLVPARESREPSRGRLPFATLTSFPAARWTRRSGIGRKRASAKKTRKYVQRLSRCCMRRSFAEIRRNSQSSSDGGTKGTEGLKQKAALLLLLALLLSISSITLTTV